MRVVVVIFAASVGCILGGLLYFVIYWSFFDEPERIAPIHVGVLPTGLFGSIVLVVAAHRLLRSWRQPN